jgi:uncharacterized protein DUF3443
VRSSARLLRIGCGMLISLAALSCGGGNTVAGSSGGGPVTPASNVVGVVVDGGPTGLSSPAINTLYTTVTVCVPGTTTCQAIDHIQVDTGSYGLRLLASQVMLSLPVNTSTSGASLVECTTFVDGYSWGPVSRVDVQITGESAHSVPVQLIGDNRFPASTVPADCMSSGPTIEDTVAQFGANGILGIGPLVQDCGAACVNTAQPATYYSCTQATCVATAVPLASQVQNPVTLFSTDNNGTIIELPSVSASGAASVTGSLIFGIDTQSNNQSGSQTVLTLNQGVYITTIFNGQTLNVSFVDSGSNGTFFTDSSIAACPSPNSSFYCPASPQTLSATMQGTNGTSVAESFSVTSLAAVASTVTALPGLAGTNPTPGSFDWGLPFFYNRRVATAITGYMTSAGTGPYVAF